MSDMMIDIAAERDGRWIGEIPEMGDLELLVRGIDCEAAREMRSRRLASWGRDATGYPTMPESILARGPPQSVRDQAMNATLIHVVLMGWRNISENGEPVLYSRDLAVKMITEPAYRPFRMAVLWAADLVGKSDAYVARQRAA
jgi:hypothetical protein